MIHTGTGWIVLNNDLINTRTGHVVRVLIKNHYFAFFPKFEK